MENTPKKTKQILLVEDRRSVELNDVAAILSFDEQYISLETSMGTLSIEGSDLKIIDLSKENGHISIKGNIYAIEYSDGQKKKKGGFFHSH